MSDGIDKRTFRVPVKLVNAIDQSELPIQGFVMIPEDRLMQLEIVARSSHSLLKAADKARENANLIGAADNARIKLKADLDGLSAMWDLDTKSTAQG